jgi:hypothetical protein
MAGLHSTGIYLDGAFAPSLVTEQEHGENEAPGEPDILNEETKPNARKLLL